MRSPSQASDSELAWIAGVFDSEGTIAAPEGGRVMLRVTMTDLDVMQRLSNLGWGEIRAAKRPTASGKTVFILQQNGNDAVVWLLRLLPHLSSRRKARGYAVLHARLKSKRRFTTTLEPGKMCGRGHELAEEMITGHGTGQSLRCVLCQRENTAASAERSKEKS